MSIISSIESNNLRGSLGSRPEWLAAGIRVIIWEESLQVTNRVIVVRVEDVSGLLDNKVDISTLLKLDKLIDIVELSAYTSRGSVRSKVGDEFFRSSEELNGVLNAGSEKSVELITAPFDTMFDQVGEVSEGAHWDGLLRWILRVTVRLGLMRHDHLRVSLSSKSTGFKERLRVPNALSIDIKSSLDIVDSVDNEIERIPEVIIKQIFSVW